MKDKPLLNAEVAERLKRLGFEPLMSTTWRSTLADVMVFVTVQDNTSDRYVTGHMTKVNAGLGVTVKPYSPTYWAT